MSELDALTDSVIGKAAAAGLAALMLALVEEGLKPTTAVRLAGVVAVAEELGPKFFETRLGVPAKTVERWRAEARHALGKVGGDEDRLAEIYRRVGMDLLAADLPEVFARERGKS